MRKLKLMNEWKSDQFSFFQVMYFNLDIAVGRVGILTIVVAPGLVGLLYISVIVLGFGFSILVGTPRNKAGIFR